MERDKTEGILYHKRFSNHVCVDFNRLGFEDVIFKHVRRLNGFNTHVKGTDNKAPNGGVAVVCRRSKTDDDDARPRKSSLVISILT